MALPLVVARSLAFRAVSAFGRGRQAATVDFGQVKFKFSLAQGGRGLRKAQRRMAAATKRAAIAAANEIGKAGLRRACLDDGRRVEGVTGRRQALADPQGRQPSSRSPRDRI